MKKSNKKYIEILWSFGRSMKAKKKLFTFHSTMTFLRCYQSVPYRKKHFHLCNKFYIFLYLSASDINCTIQFLFTFWSNPMAIFTSYFLRKFQPTQRSSKIILKKRLKSVLSVLHSSRSDVCVGCFLHYFLTVFFIISLFALVKVCMRQTTIYSHSSCVTT